GTPDRPLWFAFSPNGKALATLLQNGSLIVWDVTSGKTLRRLPPGPRLGGAELVAWAIRLKEAQPTAVLFHPAGDYLVYLRADGIGVLPWDRPRALPVFEAGTFRSLAFDRTGAT